MALAPFFSRVAASAGGLLSISRETLEKILEDVTPSIIVSETPSQNDLWTAEMLVLLLSRIYPRVEIQGPQELVSLAKSINPDIEIHQGQSRNWETTIVAGCAPAETGALWCTADGWVARVAFNNSPHADSVPNPYSSGVAACIAASELFRRIFLGRRMPQEAVLSLLDFGADSGKGESLPELNLDGVALVGLGAVAHGLLWTLGRHEGRKGSGLALVDDEKLELSNVQRYAGARLEDVGVAKTEIARRLVESSTLKCLIHPTTLADFCKSQTESPHTICVSVDNVEARRATQAMLPRLVINGYTGTGSLGVSWHDFATTRACLACLYHPTKQSPSHADLIASAFGITPHRAAILLAVDGALEPQELNSAAARLGATAQTAAQWAGKPLRALYTSVICGGTDIPIPARGRSEVVPLAHQSALAGVLLGAELVKRLVPTLAVRSQKTTLVAWHNILGKPPASWLEPRAKVRGCICGDPDYASRFAQKWPSLTLSSS